MDLLVVGRGEAEMRSPGGCGTAACGLGGGRNTPGATPRVGISPLNNIFILAKGMAKIKTPNASVFCRGVKRTVALWACLMSHKCGWGVCVKTYRPGVQKDLAVPRLTLLPAREQMRDELDCLLPAVLLPNPLGSWSR